jgi:hypothetical protein
MVFSRAKPKKALFNHMVRHIAHTNKTPIAKEQ